VETPEILGPIDWQQAIRELTGISSTPAITIPYKDTVQTLYFAEQEQFLLNKLRSVKELEEKEWTLLETLGRLCIGDFREDKPEECPDIVPGSIFSPGPLDRSEWFPQNVVHNADADPVHQTYGTVLSLPVLSPTEEQILLRVCKYSHDEDMKKIASAELIFRNSRFVLSKANTYVFRNYLAKAEAIDYMQAGFEGLLDSIDRFDVTVGTKFLSYAGSWVWKHMQRFHGKLQDATRHISEDVGLNADEVSDRLEQQPDHGLGVEEEVDISFEQEFAQALLKTLEPGSIEELVVNMHFGFNGFSPHTFTQIQTYLNENPSVVTVGKQLKGNESRSHFHGVWRALRDSIRAKLQRAGL
jgi:DNA-directed RNA polymerase sigma subunit (sigma70/sigma32)